MSLRCRDLGPYRRGRTRTYASGTTQERIDVFASNYPLADVFVSTLYFVLMIFWIILVFHVVFDVFRSHDLSGPGKALWILFILVLPLVGTLIYVLVRGGSMHERQVQAVQSQQKAFEDYIRKVANTKE
jgi:ABC-type multidrug transport system fused ATPase/permease subunit